MKRLPPVETNTNRGDESILQKSMAINFITAFNGSHTTIRQILRKKIFLCIPILKDPINRK